MTDCRFKKIKVLVPILRELELPTPNMIQSIDSTDIVLNDNTTQLYIGSNAVHYFNHDFYKKLNYEIQKQMNKNLHQFSFISLTPELIKHSDRITKMTKTDKVRYCLSGSEAVDVGFKDVKMSTGKNMIVRFKNAYHGHISGVSNDADNQIYLEEMNDKSIQFIEDNHYKIAGVVVNPMQFLSGPNKMSPPGEKVTIGKRQNNVITRDEYAKWLHKLNKHCKYCSKYLSPIAFIMDDIYFAFRTESIFSFKYFEHNGEELDPDLIILGKGLAGGFPLSAVCGKEKFMNHYDRNYLLKVNKSVGTFSAWEGGIVASNVFLDKIETMKEDYNRVNKKFDTFTKNTNDEFAKNKLPIRLRSFANVFSIDYLEDSLYNSMYPQFLMAEDVYFSNQSTGKFNLSDEWSEKKLEILTNKLISAGVKMKNYGFLEKKNNKYWFITLLKMFSKNFLINQYKQIMLDKHIDIDVSHNHPFNKFGHFWSSIGMIFISYPAMISGHYSHGVKWFLFTHTLRQAGHFFYERQNRDDEKLKFGHKDGTKKFAAVGVGICVISYIYKNKLEYLSSLSNDYIAINSALMTVLPHFFEICHKYGYLRAIQWGIKIVTDPFTDLLDFYSYAIVHPKYFVDFNFSDNKRVK